MTMQEEVIGALYPSILVLDFGSQYSHLIVRRLRDMGIYSEMIACNAFNSISWTPKGIILSGGPYSVYEPNSPHADPKIWDLNIPILGICYGLQEIAWRFKGTVAACDKREYGRAALKLSENALFHDIKTDAEVWMSHGDQLQSIPDQFQAIASTPSAPYCAIAHTTKHIFGIQFHPEVTHTPIGPKILENFCISICHCTPSWNMESFIEKEIARIRSVVGPTDQVIGAVSGGVDSTVAAKLMKEAIGDRFHAVLVDNGLMRLNECQDVKKQLNQHLGINLEVIDASNLFLERLKGVTDPEKKRKIIGNTFINVFEEAAQAIEDDVKQKNQGKIEFLLQGTLYPDVIESVSFKGPSATIKTHHNVGGLLEKMKLKLIEPLRELFKDEVRHLGKLLDIEEDLVWRHPFPGPGLAIRVLGEVTPSQLEIVRQADDIFISEIKKAGLYRSISQAYAALLPIQTVGVMGDQRTYEQCIALRAVKTTDFMTADWVDFPHDTMKIISSRIINETRGVNRVFYDVSSKPPSTIEME